MNVKIVELTPGFVPMYGSSLSAGADIKADLTNCEFAIREGNKKVLYIEPRERALVPAGFRVQLKKGTEMQIRPRSGMCLKEGITVLNTPGTIDADYRGEVKVILYNATEYRYKVEHGDRVAQAVVAPYIRANWNKVSRLDGTERGDGGFGHTGKQENLSPSQSTPVPWYAWW